MKPILLFLAFLACDSTLIAALGDDRSKCNDEYGELSGERGDPYHTQNTEVSFDVADVVFNRHGNAIEVVYYRGSFTEEEIEKILALNGKDWKKERAPLGSSMDSRKVDRWITPDGRIAEREKGNAGEYLVLFTQERLDQYKSKGLKNRPPRSSW